MEAKELINKLNSLNITQNSIDPIEDLPDEIYEKYFKDTLVAEGIYVDKHRWYETSVSVYKIEDFYIGIIHISNMYSESCSVSDIEFTPEFVEMKEVTKVSYELK